MDKQTVIAIHTDGGSRGNPGPAGIGVSITGRDGEIVGIGKRIGVATNNVAEYSALLAALTWLEGHGDALKEYTQIAVYMDSQLVVSQINGIYKIKDAKLAKLLFLIRTKEATLPLPISYTHIRREANKRADQLVNLALDNHI